MRIYLNIQGLIYTRAALHRIYLIVLGVLMVGS